MTDTTTTSVPFTPDFNVELYNHNKLAQELVEWFASYFTDVQLSELLRKLRHFHYTHNGNILVTYEDEKIKIRVWEIREV